MIVKSAVVSIFFKSFPVGRRWFLLLKLFWAKIFWRVSGNNFSPYFLPSYLVTWRCHSCRKNYILEIICLYKNLVHSYSSLEKSLDGHQMVISYYTVIYLHCWNRQKKVLHTFDNVFHVYLMNGLQKYIYIFFFTVAFWDNPHYPFWDLRSEI